MKAPKYCINRDLWIILPDGEVHWCTVVRYDEETRQYVVTIDLTDTTGNSTFMYNEEDLYETCSAAWNAVNIKKEKQQMKNKPFKYVVSQRVWTILDCDPVKCTIFRTGRNICGEPEYLVKPDPKAGHSGVEYWTAEEHLYGNELDAVTEALRLWDDKHKKAVEDADYILSHKLAYLALRKGELEKQQKQDLSGQTLTTGYTEIGADKMFSSVTVTTAAKLGIKGGAVEALTLQRGAVVHLMSGKIDRTAVYSGAQLIADGGYVHSASVPGGSMCIVGLQANTPYVQQAVLTDSANVYLCNAIGSGFWVREGSTLRLGHKAVADDTVIGSAGKVNISSGASMRCCTICSGGTLTMYGSESYIENLTINTGGIVRYVEDNR